MFAQSKGVFIFSSLDYGNNCNVRKALGKVKLLKEIPIGVDISRFNPFLDPLVIKKRYEINQAKTVVLFVGGLDRSHYFKGLQYLLSAFSKLHNKENCYLLVVGEGDLKPYFFQLAQNLGIRDRTIFAGRVPDESLPLFYACSDFLVLPSFTMSEAFGLVLLEAMACGKPVIASNIPGVRSCLPLEEWTFSGASSVEDLCTKMACLIDDICLRKKLGLSGRRKVETQHNWANIGLELDRTLRAIVH